MFSNSLFNDIGNMLERRGELLHLVVAESDVIGKLAVISRSIHSLLEFNSRLLILFFFKEQTPFSDYSLGGASLQILSKGPCVGHLFKFILDSNLELGNAV